MYTMRAQNFNRFRRTILNHIACDRKQTWCNVRETVNTLILRGNDLLETP